MARADGTIALVDFGVGKRQNEKLTQTHHGTIFGTPYYLSPEQASGQRAVEASDIYSLGVIFHELLTGPALRQRNGAGPAARSRRGAGAEAAR